MRKRNALDPLLSRSLQGILAATLMQPERAWNLSQLARVLGSSPSTLQAPLANLVRAGVLRRSVDGNRVDYQADPDCPFLVDLRSLITKTVGLADVLQGLLAPFEARIALAFVHGSIARGTEGPRSDVDLLVVGSVGLAALSPVLREAEKRLSRPVNATVLPAAEFSSRIAARDHFLNAVLATEKVFVKGGKDDLEELVGRRPRRATRRDPERARRSAIGRATKPR
jgi:predicted nucleotidyltransferase